MGNISPTATIILAELAAVLVVALGIVLYFKLRKGPDARADFDTLFQPQAAQSVATRAPPPEDPPPVVSDAAARNVALVDSPTGQSPANTPPGGAAEHGAAPRATIDPAFAAQTEQLIADLRAELETTKNRVAQLSHDNKLMSKELERMMENERSDVKHVQKDVIRLRRHVEELEPTVTELDEQYRQLSKTLKSVRMEVDTLANEYAAAYTNTRQTADKEERARPAAADAPPETPSVQATAAATNEAPSPAAAPDTPSRPEDADPSLIDSPLEAFNEALAEAETVDDAPDGDSQASIESDLSEQAPSKNAAGRDEPQETAPQHPAGGADTSADESAGSPPAGSSTLERLFDAPATFKAGDSREGINVQEIDLEELNIDDPHGLTTDPDHPAHFEVDRVFYQTSTESPEISQGWYFSVRGGDVHGPFKDKETAERVLNEIIKQYQEAGNSGGR